MRIILFLCLVFICLVAVGCTPTNVTPTTPTEKKAPTTTAPTAPEKEAPATKPPKLAKIGEETSNGKVAIIVHSVKFCAEITGGLGATYKPSKEGYIFAIIELTIKNISEPTHTASPSNVRLMDSSGKSCPRPLVIIAGEPYDFERFSAVDISTGEEARGMMLFAVEAGATLAKVSYRSQPQIEVSLDDLKATPSPYSIPKLGQPARGGGIEMIVHSVATPEEMKGKHWTTKPKEGYKIVVLDVAVKNLAIEPYFKVNSLNVVLLADSQAYISGGLALGMPLEEKLRLTELSPGEEAQGYVVFSLPVEATPRRAMYRIGVLGPPVQVRLT